MNLISRSKKTVPATAVPPASPLTDIGDVSVAAQMFDRLREHNNQYNRAIEALIATQRIVNGWDKSEPAMSLSVQRDVLVALDDTQALANFDRDHGEALERERSAQQQAAEQLQQAPARIKALEDYINTLARTLKTDYDRRLIEQEAERIFRPSAQRMLVAAKAFVQAWREMQTIEAVLSGMTHQFHYSVAGNLLTSPALDLIGETRNGDLLPMLIEGLSFEELDSLNHDYRSTDGVLAQALDDALTAAGFDGRGLKVYHPKSDNDPRSIYAPDPNPPKKGLPPYAGNGICDLVRVDV